MTTAAPEAPVSPSLAATIETLRQLSADPGIWATLPSGDGPAPYLPWPVVTRILDAGAPGWECETVAIHETDDSITVTVKLIIRGVGRCASYQQALTGKRRDGNIFQVSAPLEKAERRALARAAGLFGLGAEAPARGRSRGNPQPAQSEPAADPASTCGSCGQKSVGRKRDGSFYERCLDCTRQGKGQARKGPARPADGDVDAMAMIERLPPDPARFTAFLRRMQGASAAEVDKRYLWDVAKHHGLAYDHDAAEFVQAATGGD